MHTRDAQGMFSQYYFRVALLMHPDQIHTSQGVMPDASILISPSCLRAFNFTRAGGASSRVCVWRGDGMEIVPLFLHAEACLLNFFFLPFCISSFLFHGVQTVLILSHGADLSCHQ